CRSAGPLAHLPRAADPDDGGGRGGRAAAGDAGARGHRARARAGAAAGPAGAAGRAGDDPGAGRRDRLRRALAAPGDLRRAHGRAAMRTRALRGRRLALVIAPSAVTAVELETTWRGPRAGRIAECEVGPPAPDGAWPELEAALAELVETLRLERCVADVLLARPLAHAKIATLPPVRRRDLRPLLQRSARRWFPVRDGAVAAEALPLARRGVRVRKRARAVARGGGAAQGAVAASPATTAMPDGAAPPGGERGATGIRALAMVAPETVVRGTTDALARAGLRPGVVAPVSVALAALALRRARRRDARSGFALVARGAGWAERIVIGRGEPRLFQPLPAGPDAACGITADALPDARSDTASGGPSASASNAAHERSANDCAEAPRRAIRIRGLDVLPAPVAAALGAATALRDQPLLLPAPL